MAPHPTPWRDHPAFQLGRAGAGLSLAVDDWHTPESLFVWRGLLMGFHWEVLTRLLDEGQQPAPGGALFENEKAADRCIRAALGANGQRGVPVLAHPTHAVALLAVAPTAYAVHHPVRRAVHAWSADLLGALLDAGGATQLESPTLPNTPLHHAAGLGWPQGVYLLLDAGARADVLDVRGQTALHLAADQGLCASLRTLIEHGADVDALNRRGRTALSNVLAQRAKRLRGAEGRRLAARVAQVLLEEGASIEMAAVSAPVLKRLRGAPEFSALVAALDEWGLQQVVATPFPSTEKPARL